MSAPRLSLPYVRVAGSAGPGIVCIHSNASTSSQWRALMDRMASGYRVHAADSLGAGRSPAWPRNRAVTLRDEVALLEPVFAAAGEPHFLVGHSYGAAVALIAALQRPQRVRAIAVYEPTLFGLLEQREPGGAASTGSAAPPPMPPRRSRRTRRTTRPNGSSTTGWARAPGPACRRRARCRSPKR